MIKKKIKLGNSTSKKHTEKLLKCHFEASNVQERMNLSFKV